MNDTLFLAFFACPWRPCGQKLFSALPRLRLPARTQHFASIFDAFCSHFSPSFRELVLVQFHIDAPPPERHAFHLQTQALIERRMSAQLDLTPRSQNPVPGETTRRAQGAGYQPRSAWISGGLGDRSVGGNVSAGHSLNGGDDTIAHLDFPSGATWSFLHSWSSRPVTR